MLLRGEKYNYKHIPWYLIHHPTAHLISRHSNHSIFNKHIVFIENQTALKIYKNFYQKFLGIDMFRKIFVLFYMDASPPIVGLSPWCNSTWYILCVYLVLRWAVQIHAVTHYPINHEFWYDSFGWSMFRKVGYCRSRGLSLRFSFM